MTSIIVTMNTPARRSPIALTILVLLYEEPMHPYRIQQLIKERGKDLVVNVRQRASLYQTIDRLQRDGLIRVQETTRRERWPERTVYELTEEGRATTLRWLREMLAAPAREFPEFPAAVAQLSLLAPEDVLRQLEKREARLAERIATLDEQVAPHSNLPRVFLLEVEYIRVMLQAELDWVRSVTADLRTGRLTWSGIAGYGEEDE
jgi:DNA-binding PadR family transcriptional regulator